MHFLLFQNSELPTIHLNLDLILFHADWSEAEWRYLRSRNDKAHTTNKQTLYENGDLSTSPCFAQDEKWWII